MVMNNYLVIIFVDANLLLFNYSEESFLFFLYFVWY